MKTGSLEANMHDNGACGLFGAPLGALLDQRLGVLGHGTGRDCDGLEAHRILTKTGARSKLNACALVAVALLALSGCETDTTPKASPAQRCAAMCADAGLVVANFETGWECRCMTPLLRCDAAWNRADLVLEQLAACQTSLHECGSKSRGGGL